MKWFLHNSHMLCLQLSNALYIKLCVPNTKQKTFHLIQYISYMEWNVSPTKRTASYMEKMLLKWYETCRLFRCSSTFPGLYVTFESLMQLLQVEELTWYMPTGWTFGEYWLTMLNMTPSFRVYKMLSLWISTSGRAMCTGLMWLWTKLWELFWMVQSQKLLWNMVWKVQVKIKICEKLGC